MNLVFYCCPVFVEIMELWCEEEKEEERGNGEREYYGEGVGEGGGEVGGGEEH